MIKEKSAEECDGPCFKWQASVHYKSAFYVKAKTIDVVANTQQQRCLLLLYNKGVLFANVRQYPATGRLDASPGGSFL